MRKIVLALGALLALATLSAIPAHAEDAGLGGGLAAPHVQAALYHHHHHHHHRYHHRHHG